MEMRKRCGWEEDGGVQALVSLSKSTVKSDARGLEVHN